MPHPELQRARDQYAAGETSDAYRTLTVACGSPDPFADELPAAVALLADIARTFGDIALADKLDALRAQPGDPDGLFDIAYDLYEQGQHAAASALLYRANAIAPGQLKIVSELAGALEHQLRYGEAALIAEQSGLATREPFAIYLSGFAWLMVGDVDRARERAGLLAGVTDARLQFMRDALAAMVARADALARAGIALDDRALTAWQAAIDGTLLLHESPHGHPDPMRGRYAYVADSAARQREGLDRLHAVLAARTALPPRILSAPDRASRILGLAAGRLFGVPHAPWTTGDTAPALVVAWSMETVGDVAFARELHDHRAGQVLHVHASSWTDPFPYAPDTTTLLHQTATHPWTGGALRYDPDTQTTSRGDPDPRPDDALADEIATAEIDDAAVSALDAILAISRALDGLPEPQRAGLGRTTGKRIHQRAGGPVPSNRFI